MLFFSPPLSVFAAAVVCSDDTVLLTPGRMSQRQVKERDKEREKEAGLQTPNREHVASPSTLSPGVSYTHGKIGTPPFWEPQFTANGKAVKKISDLNLQFSFSLYSIKLNSVNYLYMKIYSQVIKYLK